MSGLLITIVVLQSLGLLFALANYGNLQQNQKAILQVLKDNQDDIRLARASMMEVRRREQ